MIDRDTLQAIEEMLDRKLDKLDKKIEEKSVPIRREILTLHGMVHGLESDVSDLRSNVSDIKTDINAVKKQTVYNYDKILNNYGVIKELQTAMEDKADKQSLGCK